MIHLEVAVEQILKIHQKRIQPKMANQGQGETLGESNENQQSRNEDPYWEHPWDVGCNWWLMRFRCLWSLKLSSLKERHFSRSYKLPDVSSWSSTHPFPIWSIRSWLHEIRWFFGLSEYLPDLPGHGRAFGADSGGVASTTAAGATGGCHRRSDEVRPVGPPQFHSWMMLDGEVGWEVRWELIRGTEHNG